MTTVEIYKIGETKLICFSQIYILYIVFPGKHLICDQIISQMSKKGLEKKYT